VNSNPSHPQPILGEGNSKNYHIFVVDDDDLVRTSLARRLRREGFDIREFESGESVIEFLDQVSVAPDAIIMDFKMTGLNGVETTKLIRQRGSSVPVILLTAYPGAMNQDEAQRERVFKILTKTIDLEGLPQVIYDAIQHQRT
jgi:DNA-binding NtrC family response regulator